MDVRNRRIDIFKQVQDGRLTLDEASRRLAAIEQGSGSEPEALADPTISRAAVGEGLPDESSPAQGISPGPDLSATPGDPPVEETGNQPEPGAPQPPVLPAEVLSARNRPRIWHGWWLWVFVPGLLLIVASANWMVEGFQAARLGWGFWLSFIPFTLGVLLVWLSWEIRLARWLTIHIRQRPGARPHELLFSLPLPTGWVSWLIRQTGRLGPHLNGTEVGDLIQEIDQAVAVDGPLQISIDDPHGEQIEIWME